MQIAFGPGAPSSNLLRTYGAQRGGTDSRKRSPNDNYGQVIGSLPSTSKEDAIDICSSDAVEASAPKIKREYIEPWVKFDRSNITCKLQLFELQQVVLVLNHS